MKTRNALPVATTTLAATFLVTAAYAQGLEVAVISGTVHDRTGAVVAHVVVTATSPSLIGGPRSTTTNDEGQYRLPALHAGAYELRMTRDGFSAAVYSDVLVAAGGSVDVDGVLDVASNSEHVDVTAPTVDVRTSASTQGLNANELQHLPAARGMASLINLTPGVSQGVGFGGTQNSNALWVEGVDVTDPNTQAPAAQFSYNWLDGMQVLAPGAPAEYGQFTGVGATYQLRSGSNHLSGLFEVLNTPPSWQGSNSTDFPPTEILSSWDGSAQLGGPLDVDRAWFFFGYHYVHDSVKPFGYAGPGSTTTTNPEAILKLTASPGRTVRLDGFLQHGHTLVAAEELGPFTPLEASKDLNVPQTAWNVRTTWTPGSRDVVDMRIGGYSSASNFEPHPPSGRDGPAPHYDEVTGVSSGNVQSYEEMSSSEQTVAMAWTRYMAHAPGLAHELKVGFEYEHARVSDATHIPGGALYIDDDGVPAYVQIWGGEILRASTNRTSMYVQDNWRLRSSITVNAGMRLDVNRGSIPAHGTLLSTSPLAARVGAAWDVTPRHRTVVRAHYGRYYEANFAQWVMSSDQTVEAPEIFGQVTGPGSYDVIDVSTPNPWRSYIDPALEQAYVDQYSAGVEHEVTHTITTEVQFVRRNFDRVFGISSEGSEWSPLQAVDPGPDGTPGTPDDGGALTVYSRLAAGERILTNPDGFTRHYTGLQVMGRKRYDKRWQMQASYTWSRTRGNVSNGFQANSGHLGVAGDYGDPNRQINGNGAAPLDFTNSVKLLGTYTLPSLGGTNVSGIYQFDSGGTWERQALFFTPRPELVRVEPRGTRRLPASSALDMRIDKTFRAGAGHIVGAYVEGFNLTNRGVATGVNNVSGPSLGLPSSWSAPRTGRIGVRWMF